MGRLWSGAMGQGGSVAVEEDDSDVMVAGFVKKKLYGDDDGWRHFHMYVH